MIRLSTSSHSKMDAIKADVSRLNTLFVGTATKTGVAEADARLAAMGVKLHKLRMSLRGDVAEARAQEKKWA